MPDSASPILPSGSAPAAPEGRSRRARLGALVLAPALIWWALFLVLPMGLVLATAFFKGGPYGAIIYEPTLGNLERAIDPLYAGVLWHSLWLALLATGICLALGYPAAAYIASRPSARTRTLLLVLVILPFWTNFLIRTYAWIVLLNREGVVNGALERLGLIDEPLSLLYNDAAVVLGLVYGYLPLMILPLYAAIERINPQILEASTDLGARPFRSLRTVMLPLIVPGIVAGCIFVFVPSLGNIPVPELLGGGRSEMIGNLVNRQFLTTRDWPFGSTLVLALMMALMALLVLQSIVLRRTREVDIDA
jgi:spermidine/putrescine transport system permease protein